MNRIRLMGDAGSRWFHAEGCSVRGTLFSSGGRLLEGESLLQYFGEVTTPAGLQDKLQQATGSFAVVIETGETVLLGADVIRSRPLFYGRDDKGWVVSDRALEVAETLSLDTLDPLAVAEFRGTGYVTGSGTLLKGLQQVQAGEVVALGERVSRQFYFTYRVKAAREEPFDVLYREAVQVLEGTFARLVESLNGRTAVVPLSGGFDSRLIAVMLKRAGYEKVVCFTYGRPGNAEAERSRMVAEKLGLTWHFIATSEKRITGFTGSGTFEEYVPRAANFSSMFFMQEYFAVQHLKEQGLVPPDAVFIPGHSGDFLGGSQFAKHGFGADRETVRRLTGRILRIKYHYARYGWRKARAMRRRIAESLAEKDPGWKATAWSVHEDWDMKEKLARFNANSVTTYSCFGYDFRLPYWDTALVKFFREVPVAFRINKELYDKVLCEVFFKPSGVLFPGEEGQAEGKKSRGTAVFGRDPLYARVGRLKRRIRRMMPLALSGVLSGKEDPICYREITAVLQTDMLRRGRKVPRVGNAYNRAIIEWYLDRLEEQFGKG